VLSGVNAYIGGMVLTAGTLQLANAVALDATTGPLTVNGGTLVLNGYTPAVGKLSGAGGTIRSTAAGVILTANFDADTSLSKVAVLSRSERR
jgi:hypothetical protein